MNADPPLRSCQRPGDKQPSEQYGAGSTSTTSTCPRIVHFHYCRLPNLSASWDSIRQTSGITDAELNERFRNTALYTALLATLPKRHQPAGYVLSPMQA